MTHFAQPVLSTSRLYATVLAMTAMPLFGVTAMGQYAAGTAPTTSQGPSQNSATAIGVTRNVPSDPATTEVLYLTLREAITRALPYDLATIEGGESAHMARGQAEQALACANDRFITSLYNHNWQSSR